MRNLLVMAVAVSLCASAWAGSYYPTRDAGINRAGGEQYANMGVMTQVRVAKGRQHYLLMDFDWAAIKAEVDATPGAWAELSVVNADDQFVGAFCRVVMSGTDTVDWIEGDGASAFANFNWTNPTQVAAVTSHAPQTLSDGLDPAGPIPAANDWPWNDFDGRRDQDGFKNTTLLVFAAAGVRTPGCVLDADILASLASGVTPHGDAACGLYTYDSGTYWLNGEVYTREAGTDLSPRIDVVPEPATMLLIGLGGAALLLRKRR
jgi:hypothetical protein